jgi:hypothetical protein
MTRENPHIVNVYFMKRVQALLDTYYGGNGLELDWSWFRIEYQERGTAHAHGCFSLKCNPGISDLAEKVLKGRIAEKKLVEPGYGNANNGISIHENDSLLEKVEEVSTIEEPLTEVECDALFEEIFIGNYSGAVICQFSDKYLSTNHRKPPTDTASNEREDATNFVQGEDNQHPNNVDMRTILDGMKNWQQYHDCAEDALEHFNTQYSNQLDAVERHRCSLYCSKTMRKLKRGESGNSNDPIMVKDCRFSYPKCIFLASSIYIVDKLFAFCTGNPSPSFHECTVLPCTFVAARPVVAKTA